MAHRPGTWRIRRILVAGCGTSQAARYALREPDAKITAIDISGTSLRYTRQLQQKYRLDNLDLHQLSIERVHELGRTLRSGGLHRRASPSAASGRRSACASQCLASAGGHAPDGCTPCYGRTGVYMMQEYCRLLGITTSDTDLRELGDTLPKAAGNLIRSPTGHEWSDRRVNHPDVRSADALLRIPNDRA